MTAREFVALYGTSSGPVPDQALILLDDPRFRREVLREVHQSVSTTAALLRTILEREVSYRETGGCLEYFENLYWCAFLLWRVGEVVDVIPLWRAKNIDFDTGCGLDVQFLVGAGLDETIRYLRSTPGSEAHAALDYILECKKIGDFDAMQEWAKWREEYFRPRPDGC